MRHSETFGNSSVAESVRDEDLHENPDGNLVDLSPERHVRRNSLLNLQCLRQLFEIVSIREKTDNFQ